MMPRASRSWAVHFRFWHASATRVEIDSEVVNAPWVEHETIGSVWSGHEHGTNTTRPLFVPNDYLYGFLLKELASSLS